MPEDQNKPKDEAQTPQPGKDGANISPSVTDVTGDNPKPADGSAAPASSKIQPEALADGTVPTVLKTGDTHVPVSKNKTSLTSLYRKADVTTTIITFVIVIIAGAALAGGYYFFTGANKKPTPKPTLSALNSSQLKSLNDFFKGNSAGNNTQILTVGSASLFKQRVGISSDLAVTGGATVAGPTSLGQLVVDQNSTLGVTDVRGALTVSGPSNLQNSVTMSSGATVKGNLAVSGSGSFGTLSATSLSVSSLSVTGSLNLDNNLIIGGSQAGGSSANSACSNVVVTGNDSAGTITFSCSANVAGTLASVNFHTAFSAVPIVNITPIGPAAAKLEPYLINPGAGSFSVGAVNSVRAEIPYSFNYWVVQY